MNKKELENFLYYLEDKVESCYKKEVHRAIEEFLKGTAQEVPVQEQSNRKFSDLENTKFQDVEGATWK